MNSPEPPSASPDSPEEVPLEKPVRQALLFRVLSVLWIFPSIGAGWLLASDTAWCKAETIMGGVRAFTAEQWIALLILALHLRFMVGAWKGRTITVPERASPKEDQSTNSL